MFYVCVFVCCVAFYNTQLPIRGNNFLGLAAFRARQLLQFTWDWRHDEVVCGQPETQRQRSMLMQTAGTGKDFNSGDSRTRILH